MCTSPTTPSFPYCDRYSMPSLWFQLKSMEWHHSRYSLSDIIWFVSNGIQKWRRNLFTMWFWWQITYEPSKWILESRRREIGEDGQRNRNMVEIHANPTMNVGQYQEHVLHINYVEGFVLWTVLGESKCPKLHTNGTLFPFKGRNYQAFCHPPHSHNSPPLVTL